MVAEDERPLLHTYLPSGATSCSISYSLLYARNAVWKRQQEFRMGNVCVRDDFEWVYTQHPHVDRRKKILNKYPEIKKLMGPDPELKWIVSAMVVFQIVSCYYVQHLSWFWLVVLSYCLGGSINHSLTLAVHDICHNVAFGNKYPLANRLFGMLANCPIGIPMSISFKKYHLEHHRFQGADGYDVDLPTAWEGRFFHNSFTKLIWLFLQPGFYALRPFVVRPKPITHLELVNIAVQVVFDGIIWYFFGAKGLGYLVIGTVLALGLHPMSAHFIAEHYMFDRGYETYSYYGVWNYVTFNVGYHMEHHDFPYIPGSRLPEVRRIAAEFYDHLPQHKSWLTVLWVFLFDPKMGPYARVKRNYDDVFKGVSPPHGEEPVPSLPSNGHVSNGHVAVETEKSELTHRST